MTNYEKSELINKTGSKLQKELMLTNWSIDFNYKDESYDDCLATCDSSPEYLSAIINVYKDAFDEEHFKNLESTIKHELCHCITEELFVFAVDLMNGRFRTIHDLQKIREKTTEWISRI